MKNKQGELDVDFIGGGRPLTKADEIAISNFIRAEKVKRSGRYSTTKRKTKPSRRKIIA